jgi:exopolyphosphatase/guanosine-5'-triphosphate,3'-diphosphate pyrophosphatase
MGIHPAPATSERLAAIDVGSNSIRMSVAEYSQAKGLLIVDEVKDQPRLAAGVAETGSLDRFAMARAIAVLRRMKEVAERRGVTRLRAIATSAVREADNGPLFVKRVQRETGIAIEVIDGEAEANLSFRSVAHHFPMTSGRALIADIGGGSLELVGAANGLIELTRSLPLGAVRLTERWLTGSKATPRAVARLRSWVRKRLDKAVPERTWRGAILIGSGGSFTNLGRMVRARRGYDIGQAVHGESVTTAELEQLLEWLAAKTTAERAVVPGLNPQRADIILAGLAVTAELLDLLEARQLTVSAYGLREGILLEMVGEERGLPADPLRAMRELVERCQGDLRHAEQVRELGLQLFARLGPTLGCRPDERRLLEAACLLHDVGQVVSYRRHHRHSHQLILHADRLRFTARDRQLVATISRYHRKKGPRNKDPEIARLNEEDRQVVRRLVGLLRVADGLDRGHSAMVAELTTRLTKERLSIRITARSSRADLSLELWGAARRVDVLEKLLRRPVRFDLAPKS